jgi:hypothetical protein
MPGPLQAFIAKRWQCGKASSACSCQWSGSTPKTSRTIRAGWSAHSVRSSCGRIVIVIRTASPLRLPFLADRPSRPRQVARTAGPLLAFSPPVFSTSRITSSSVRVCPSAVVGAILVGALKPSMSRSCAMALSASSRLNLVKHPVSASKENSETTIEISLSITFCQSMPTTFETSTPPTMTFSTMAKSRTMSASTTFISRLSMRSRFIRTISSSIADNAAIRARISLRRSSLAALPAVMLSYPASRTAISRGTSNARNRANCSCRSLRSGCVGSNMRGRGGIDRVPLPIRIPMNPVRS